MFGLYSLILLCIFSLTLKLNFRIFSSLCALENKYEYKAFCEWTRRQEGRMNRNSTCPFTVTVAALQQHWKNKAACRFRQWNHEFETAQHGCRPTIIIRGNWHLNSTRQINFFLEINYIALKSQTVSSNKGWRKNAKI